MARVRLHIGRRSPAAAAADTSEGLVADVCAPAEPLYGIRRVTDSMYVLDEALQVDDDVVGSIRRVAEEVQPLAVDYGETAWNPHTGTVLWVAGDGTTEDEVAEVEAKFRAIDGVEAFAHSHEDMPDGWCDADIVHGPDLFAEACKEQAAARTDELVALASQPLRLDVPRVL